MYRIHDGLLRREPGVELERLLLRIEQRYRKRFASGVGNRLPGLRAEDLADAWQDTMRDLVRAYVSGTFDPGRDPGPWLWTTYRRRAIDRMRSRRRYRALLVRAGERQGDGAHRNGDDESIRDLLRRVRIEARRLPARQGLVFRLFLDGYPETESRELLRREVSDACGKSVSRTAVIRALGEARAKVAATLREPWLELRSG